MLQRALASLLCLLGAASIGLGIASATVWRPSDTLTATASAPEGTTLLVTDPGVLDLAADDVSVRASASGDTPVVLAVGRSADVDAWVGQDAYVRVTGLADRETLRTQEVEATTPTPTPAPDPAEPVDPAAPADAPAETTPAPDPTGSDLWLWEAGGTGEATLEWAAQEGRWSLLVATTGEDPAPPTLTLTWPQVVTTRWLVPGVVAGAVLLLAGLAWWGLLLVRARRGVAPAGASAAPAPGAAGSSQDAVAPGSGRDAAPDAPAADQTGTTTSPTTILTRRQVRELEQRQAAEREAAQREAARQAAAQRAPKGGRGDGEPRPRRFGRRREEPVAPPEVVPEPPAVADAASPQRVAPTGPSGDAWRRAWGFSGTGADTATDATDRGTADGGTADRGTADRGTADRGAAASEPPRPSPAPTTPTTPAPGRSRPEEPQR
ncbi:hypothetical protein [Actinotalea sp. JY-7876]|uniref:hypothetical protein n=1 Tax=Actinotalea sp. JY-7876 TaxID=2758442 RepID=UPI0015F5C736|nr:hypothetical protein [Actinotalea sp. JY-7876]